MPKMIDQAQRGKNSDIYQKSREKRVQEVSAYQEGQVQDDVSLYPISAIGSTTPKSEKINTASSRRVGRPPSEKTAKMSIVMDPDLRRKLKTYCAFYGTTAADVIDKLVRDFLDESEVNYFPSSINT